MKARIVISLIPMPESMNLQDTTGQSGHPYSPYYDTMIDSWRNVNYKPILWTDEQVNAVAKNTLTLKP